MFPVKITYLFPAIGPVRTHPFDLGKACGQKTGDIRQGIGSADKAFGSSPDRAWGMIWVRV